MFGSSFLWNESVLYKVLPHGVHLGHREGYQRGTGGTPVELLLWNESVLYKVFPHGIHLGRREGYQRGTGGTPIESKPVHGSLQAWDTKLPCYLQ